MNSPVAIAVISDVHGNSLALEAVLTDVRHYAPDVMVNLGDQVWGQVDPLGAYELQAGLAAVEVRGNNDEKPLLGAGRLSAFEERYAAWLSKRVRREELERIASLPLTASLVDGKLLAAHGTPASAWDNLLWRLSDGELVPRVDADVMLDLEGIDRGVEVVVVGHTHQERILNLGGRLLVNSGPVSWQKDGDPRARWTLLERRADGWTVEQRRVTYDWGAAARAVMANDPVLPVEVDAHLFGLDQRPRLQKRSC